MSLRADVETGAVVGLPPFATTENADEQSGVPTRRAAAREIHRLGLAAR
jgi:hypothetical protein